MKLVFDLVHPKKPTTITKATFVVIKNIYPKLNITPETVKQIFNPKRLRKKYIRTKAFQGHRFNYDKKSAQQQQNNEKQTHYVSPLPVFVAQRSRMPTEQQIDDEFIIYQNSLKNEAETYDLDNDDSDSEDSEYYSDYSDNYSDYSDTNDDNSNSNTNNNNNSNSNTNSSNNSNSNNNNNNNSNNNVIETERELKFDSTSTTDFWDQFTGTDDVTELVISIVAPGLGDWNLHDAKQRAKVSIQWLGYCKGAFIAPHFDLKGAFERSMAIITFADVTFRFNRPNHYGKNEIFLKKGDVLYIQEDTFCECWWKHSIDPVKENRMACVVRLVTDKK